VVRRFALTWKIEMRLKSYTSAFLALALLALVTSAGFAQEEGRRGRRGGFGVGPGGRGGDPTMGLLRIDEVKAELELTDEQQAALDKLAEQSRSDRTSRQGSNFRDMSEEERKAFIDKMQQDVAERAKQLKEKLEEVLLPGQMERLEQISLQVRGANAISDSDIREKLNISDEQIAKLAEVQESIQTTMRAKMQELFQAGDRDAMREAFGKLRKEAEENLFGVLTEDQQAQFESLKGEPFELPERGFGRGRRGGGERGFGGQGRRRGSSESSDEPL
jgi:Spy/CpxP family protein refolding chaperone